MKLSERLDHMLRQYSYKRSRNTTNHKGNSKFEIEQYLDKVSSYIDEVLEEMDNFLPKGKR